MIGYSIWFAICGILVIFGGFGAIKVGDEAAIWLIVIGVIFLIPGLSILMGNKKENSERNKLLDKVKSMVGDKTFEIIKEMDFKLLEALPDIYELGQKEQWGKIEIAFSHKLRFVYVFEEGICFFTSGELIKFTPKDKISIYEFYRVKSYSSMENIEGMLFRIKVKGGEEIISFPRDLYYEAVNMFFDWYGYIKKDEKTFKKYNEFLRKIEELSKDHILYTFPYDLKNLSYGQFISESSQECLILGKNLENNALIMEYGPLSEGLTPIVKIPYEDIAAIEIEGEIDTVSNYLDGHFEEGKWDGKRLAAGYVIAGPVGAALMGKSKSKYVEPVDIVSQEIDHRRISIFLNEEISYLSKKHIRVGHSMHGTHIALTRNFQRFIKFEYKKISFPYKIMLGFFESTFPEKVNNSEKTGKVNYQNYQKL